VGERLQAAGVDSNVMALWKELVAQEVTPEDDEDEFE
jgi:hypothetical protein